MSSHSPSGIALTADLDPSGEFPEAALADWQRLAESSLRGRTLSRLTVTTIDGAVIKPLYTARDQSPPRGLPGSSPHVRGAAEPGAMAHRGWEVCQNLSALNPTEAAAVIRQEIEQGVHSFWLHLRSSTEHAPADSISSFSLGVDLPTAASIADLLNAAGAGDLSLHLAAGDDFAAAAAQLVAACDACLPKGPGTAHAGHLGADPLAVLATHGRLSLGVERSLELLACLALWCRDRGWNGVPLAVSALPYHAAGANVVQEIAFAVATGVEYLRALDRAGYPVDSTPAPLRFIQPVGRDFFTEVARVRALRALWDRIMEACGAAAEHRRVEVHSVGSFRGLSTRDPWVNLLRSTVGTAAAAIAGADTITTLPFDAAIGPPDRHSRRLASTTQAILREESHLHRVADPAGGSWYVEQLTEQLAEHAWRELQELEEAGGMAACLLNGRVHQAIYDTRRRRAPLIATGREAITGVSSFPNLEERTLPRRAIAPSGPGPDPAAPDPTACRRALQSLAEAAAGPCSAALFTATVTAAAAGARRDELTRALANGAVPARTEALPVVRDSAGFEALRDRSDHHLSVSGQRPRVFLVKLGTVSEHKPRADFARNFLAAAGIESIDEGGFATVDSAVAAFAGNGSSMAVLCSTDTNYVNSAEELATRLKAHGARTVILAGKPGDNETAWRAAGIDHFIHLGCDMLDTLSRILNLAGVNND